MDRLAQDSSTDEGEQSQPDLSPDPYKRANNLAPHSGRPHGEIVPMSLEEKLFDTPHTMRHLSNNPPISPIACFETTTPDSISTSRYPKSHSKGFIPPLPECKEAAVVEELSKELERHSQDLDGFYEFDLEDFTIYLPHNPLHPFELRPLQHLTTKSGHAYFLFDGILKAGNLRRYVRGIPFDICSIGNYGEDVHTVGDDIWLQSECNKGSELYYRLKSPAAEYQRFQEGFIWLADLAKHFVDYCESCEDEGRSVSVRNFKRNFANWSRNVHKEAPAFQLWYNQYPGDDYRQAVSANIDFLFKEAVGISDSNRKHLIWEELLEKSCVPLQPLQEEKTVITPYVHDCFSHMIFGHHLKAVVPVSTAQIRRSIQENSLHMALDVNMKQPADETPNTFEAPTTADAKEKRQSMIQAIQVGDVLAVTTDGEGSLWKDELSRWKTADDCWYILVQNIHESIIGKRSFDALWFYKPSDTSCAKMKYPFPSELFLSDNCTCLNDKIKEDEVLNVASVQWHGSPPSSPSQIFIRQTYLDNDRFVTLKESHKKCQHQPANQVLEPVLKYPVGQTVLLPPKLLIPSLKSKYGLDPFEITGYKEVDGKRYATLRRLMRRNEILGQICRPNELVYCDRFSNVEASKIEVKCIVRLYSQKEVHNRAVPAPYNRDGTGNAFYITKRLVDDQNGQHRLVPIRDHLPKYLIQGFDPSQMPTQEKLRGLDLYCGGGNFGRGLEEGGALDNKWAVDYAKNAIHTYYANLDDEMVTRLYYGSVDDLLNEAMHGNPRKSKLVPQPGEVDFISAGSPCQGFSLLNKQKNNEKGLKNQSLVASVAAYVDFYRPKYGLLENVLNMARMDLGRDQDVLSQLICSIVGMGYQLQLFMIDAWSCGSPQNRSRIFVSFAAPGLEVLEHPYLSHSHPEDKRERGLGRLANGEPFGERMKGPTAFDFVTVGKATANLPDIGDGGTYQCIQFPDHVMSLGLSHNSRLQIEAIPTTPKGMNFAKAWNEGHGVMTKEQRALFPFITKSGTIRESVRKTSKAWGRIDPNKLFDNVVITAHIADARMGRILHWAQHRVWTVMEARRAQSYPDEEVITGSTADRMKILGNSVSRAVSLALGLSLRDAWLKNSLPKESGTVTTSVCSDLSLKRLNKRTLPDERTIKTRKLSGTASPGSFATQQSEDLLQWPSLGTSEPYSVGSSEEETHGKINALPHSSHSAVASSPRKVTEPRVVPARGKPYRRDKINASVSKRNLNTETSPSVESLTSLTRVNENRKTKTSARQSKPTTGSFHNNNPVDASNLRQKLEVVIYQKLAENSKYSMKSDSDDEVSPVQPNGRDKDFKEEDDSVTIGQVNGLAISERGRRERVQIKETVSNLPLSLLQRRQRPSLSKSMLALQPKPALQRKPIIEVEPKLSQTEKVYINLVSSDEEGSEDLPTEPPKSHLKFPVASKYIPVDNTQFQAYARTNAENKGPL
jgi:DNA (cytosine-5)-methyltransferase 1